MTYIFCTPFVTIFDILYPRAPQITWNWNLFPSNEVFNSSACSAATDPVIHPMLDLSIYSLEEKKESKNCLLLDRTFTCLLYFLNL